jgi:hypothetical protein
MLEGLSQWLGLTTQLIGGALALRVIAPYGLKPMAIMFFLTCALRVSIFVVVHVKSESVMLPINFLYIHYNALSPLL